MRAINFVVFYISHILYVFHLEYTQCPHAVQMATLYALSPNSFSPCQFVWRTIWYLAFITSNLRLQFNQRRESNSTQARSLWQRHRRKPHFSLLVLWHISKMAQMVNATRRISIEVLRCMHENEEAARFHMDVKELFCGSRAKQHEKHKYHTLFGKLVSFLNSVFFSLFINATEHFTSTPRRQSPTAFQSTAFIHALTQTYITLYSPVM